ncbi:MAG: N-acetylglucosamine kinase, partial [Mesorhizobium sp.]
MSAGAKHYFLGVDGGGTGCRARIEDADGTVLG